MRLNFGAEALNCRLKAFRINARGQKYRVEIDLATHCLTYDEFWQEKREGKLVEKLLAKSDRT